MSYPCTKCGYPANDINTLCSKCSSEKNMQRVMIFAVIVAVLAVGIIGLLLLQTTSSPSVEPINQVTKSPTPVKTATATPTLGNTTPAPVQTPLAIKPDVLENYKNNVQPVISDVRAEMSATILDLKEFLKEANANKDPKAVRQIIDIFREKMKKHSDRFVSLNRSLRSIAPPAQLEVQHEKLSTGISKYNGSVQGYIIGLAAYNFQQLRASQSQLEQADKEILTAMVELQDAFSITTAK